MKPILWVFFASSAAGACFPVDGDRITFSDLAKAIPEFAAAPQEEYVALAPLPGIQRRIGAAAVARLATDLAITLKAPREVCFEHPLETLTSEEFLKALARATGNAEIKIDLLDYSRFPVPKGELCFPQNGLQANSRTTADSAVIWKGEVKYSGAQPFSVWAKVRLSVNRAQAVAAQDIAAAQDISATNVHLEVCRAFPFGTGAVQDLAGLVGRQLRRAVRAGQPVTADALGPRRDIRNGETVEVLVLGPATRIALTAKAVTSGAAGDSIILLNPVNAKRFEATVTGEGRARITLAALRKERP